MFPFKKGEHEWELLPIHHHIQWGETFIFWEKKTYTAEINRNM
jgi:hypothetical protein